MVTTQSLLNAMRRWKNSSEGPRPPSRARGHECPDCMNEIPSLRSTVAPRPSSRTHREFRGNRICSARDLFQGDPERASETDKRRFAALADVPGQVVDRNSSPDGLCGGRSNSPGNRAPNVRSGKSPRCSARTCSAGCNQSNNGTATRPGTSWRVGLAITIPAWIRFPDRAPDTLTALALESPRYRKSQRAGMSLSTFS